MRYLGYDSSFIGGSILVDDALGSCKQQERCLCIFFIVNVVNWLFTIIQMIIFYVAYERCGTDDPLVSEGSPFASMCHGTNDLLVWIQSILLAGVNVRSSFYLSSSYFIRTLMFCRPLARLCRAASATRSC